MHEQNSKLGRRDFMKKGAQASAAAVLGTNKVQGAGPGDKKITFTEALPTRTLGKTGVELPMLGYGGAALPKKWGNTLSDVDRVKLVRHAYDRGIRYFDTAISYTYADSQAIICEALQDVRDNVFITTKVDFWDVSKPDGRFTTIPKGEAVRQVEMNLRELQSDYIDAILIHGTPGVEQMTVEQCMEVHGELVKARDKGLVRFVGFSAHHYFDKALALINTGEFDLCMLAYGYLPRGNNRLFSPQTTELRNACLAQSHELGMGIVAMKVLGAGMLGGFGKKELEKLPGVSAAVLSDENVKQIQFGINVIGVGAVPVGILPLDGNAAEVKTHLENLRLLDGILPHSPEVYTADTKLDSPENLLAIAPMFLQKPERMGGLLLILLWALMVMSLMERAVRQNLQGKPMYGPYLENRPSSSPTAKLILNGFSRLCIVIIKDRGTTHRRRGQTYSKGCGT